MLSSQVDSALERNETLMHVIISSCLKLSDVSMFYLKMNRLGRKALMEDLVHKNWRRILVEQKEDLSVVFFMISANLSAYLPALLPEIPSPEKKKQKLSH